MGSAFSNTKFLPEPFKTDKKTGGFCKKRVRLHKMSLSYVFPSPFFSVKVSSFCLFS
jgi:hypothetical protein